MENKKEAIEKISKLTAQITDLVIEAQKIADEEGLAFGVDLNGTGGTYYGKTMPKHPNKKDFLDEQEYRAACKKWEEDTDYMGGHPYGYDGWVNSSFDC